MESSSQLHLYKAPERVYRRRSLWGRLRRRPALLALLVLGVGAAGYAGGRAYMGLLGVLPSQRQAIAARAAVSELIAQPEFKALVTAPLVTQLADSLPTARRYDEMITHIRREQPIAADFAPPHRRPAADPSAVVRGWRDVIDGLRRRGFDVYLYPELVSKGDRSLRAYIAERLGRFDGLVRQLADEQIEARRRTGPAEGLEAYARARRARAEELVRLHSVISAGVNPADADRFSGPLDEAQRAVVRDFEVTRTEFDLFMFLNTSAVDLKNGEEGT